MSAAINMHATIMHFATCLPNWNSLDSVRRAHSDLEGAALVFFALLVVCEALAHLSDEKKTERRFDKIGIVFFALAVLAEIVAYPYGQRNDTLSEKMIGSLDAKARNVMTELDKAEGKLRQLQVFALARHINDPDALVEALKPFNGRRVLLRSYIGDAEGWLLCVSLLDAVQKAQMDATTQCGQWPFDAGKPTTGLTISGPDSGVIADAIVSKGRTTHGAVAESGPAPLLIFVGVKNPFWLPAKALAAAEQ